MDTDDPLWGALDRVVESPTLLVACAFDGALAPDEGDPAEARAEQVSSEALNVLVALADTTVAVVSDRPRDEVAELMFLSGALFPLSGLPTWLAVLTHVNPMTYAVEPLRSVVFDHLDVDAATRARFDPGIYWGTWPVPVGVQILITLACCVLLLALAVWRFRRTE